jgi:hypothetical protein
MYETIIATSKPSCAFEVTPHLLKRYPPETSLVFNIGLAGPLFFSYPRGNDFSSFPAVSEPRYRLELPRYAYPKSLADYAAVTDPTLDANEQTDARRKWRASSGLNSEDFIEALRGAQRFVYAADAGPSEAHGFSRLLQYAGVRAEIKTDAYLFYDLSEKTLSKVFGQGSTEESEQRLSSLSNEGRVKRYFDWNWNANALALFRPVFTTLGLPQETVISKFELQLLYFLVKTPFSQDDLPWTEGLIIQAMHHWKGSGKYSERQRLGSAASRFEILMHLVEKGFLNTSESGQRVSVHSRGNAFLEMLHPDCEDPDLPARLDKWMAAGFDGSKSAIDRYIRTFFGKQKRFFSKNILAAESRE